MDDQSHHHHIPPPHHPHHHPQGLPGYSSLMYSQQQQYQQQPPPPPSSSSTCHSPYGPSSTVPGNNNTSMKGLRSSVPPPSSSYHPPPSPHHHHHHHGPPPPTTNVPSSSSSYNPLPPHHGPPSSSSSQHHHHSHNAPPSHHHGPPQHHHHHQFSHQPTSGPALPPNTSSIMSGNPSMDTPSPYTSAGPYQQQHHHHHPHSSPITNVANGSSMGIRDHGPIPPLPPHHHHHHAPPPSSVPSSSHHHYGAPLPPSPSTPFGGPLGSTHGSSMLPSHYQDISRTSSSHVDYHPPLPSTSAPIPSGAHHHQQHHPTAPSPHHPTQHQEMNNGYNSNNLSNTSNGINKPANGLRKPLLPSSKDFSSPSSSVGNAVSPLTHNNTNNSNRRPYVPLPSNVDQSPASSVTRSVLNDHHSAPRHHHTLPSSSQPTPGSQLAQQKSFNHVLPNQTAPLAPPTTPTTPTIGGNMNPTTVPTTSGRGRPSLNADRKSSSAHHGPNNHGTTSSEDQEMKELSKKEQKHREVHEQIDLLNREFLKTRKYIYEDRLAELKQEIKDIQKGTHPVFQQQLKRFREERDQVIYFAQLFRDYQLTCAQTMFDEEMNNSLKEFESEKKGLRAKFFENINERKLRLREERDSFDINNDSSFNVSKSHGTRKTTRQLAAQSKSDQDSNKKEKKRKQANNAVLPFLLKDFEVLDDMSLIRKATMNVATPIKKSSKQNVKR